MVGREEAAGAAHRDLARLAEEGQRLPAGGRGRPAWRAGRRPSWNGGAATANGVGEVPLGPPGGGPSLIVVEFPIVEFISCCCW